MKFKMLILPLVLAIALSVSGGMALADKGSGNSGSGSSGSGGDENRVRIEIRADEEDPEENRVRVEVRGDEANLEEAVSLISQLPMSEDLDRLRVEVRDDENRVRIEARQEEEEELPDVEIQDNTFEITGEVTAFTEDTVTIDGQTIVIDPSVADFEQEGTIEVGETIKVEGTIEDGTFMAVEIKADLEGEEMVEAGGFSLVSILNQISSFLGGLMMN